MAKAKQSPEICPSGQDKWERRCQAAVRAIGFLSDIAESVSRLCFGGAQRATKCALARCQACKSESTKTLWLIELTNPNPRTNAFAFLHVVLMTWALAQRIKTGLSTQIKPMIFSLLQSDTELSQHLSLRIIYIILDMFKQKLSMNLWQVLLCVSSERNVQQMACQPTRDALMQWAEARFERWYFTTAFARTSLRWTCLSPDCPFSRGLGSANPPPHVTSRVLVV